MYLGRIGPISLAIFFAGRTKKKVKRNYIEGKFFVG
jgi:trk system potassium uptake protein TrkH